MDLNFTPTSPNSSAERANWGAWEVSHSGADGGPDGPGSPDAGGPSVRAGGNAPGNEPVPSYKPMKRLGFGRNGDQVQLHCNHFRVKFQPREDVYHYNVTIEPETKEPLRRRVMRVLSNNDKHAEKLLLEKRFAYDGEKSLFTVGPLGFQSHKFSVHSKDDPESMARHRYSATDSSDDEERPSQRRRIGGEWDFDVEIKLAAKVNVNAISTVIGGRGDDATQRQAQDSLRVLAIILRERATERDYLQIGDCYLHPSLGPVTNLDGRVCVWRGFHVSFRPTSCGYLTLNLDLSITTMVRSLRVDKFLEISCKNGVKEFVGGDWHRARRILTGLFVDTLPFGRKKKIEGLSLQGCHELRFKTMMRNPWDEAPVCFSPQVVTVAEYFCNLMRGLLLMYPRLPALDLGQDIKNRYCVRPQYFPMELCTIADGQRYKKTLTGVQRKILNASERQGPEKIKRMCMQVMEAFDYNNDYLVKEFNVQIEQNMFALTGRVLDPPSLVFGDREEKPTDGRWNFNSKKVKFSKEIKTWAVANFSRFRPTKQIGTELKNVCTQLGLRFSSEPKYFEEDFCMLHRGAEDRVAKMILRDMETLRPEFLLAILPYKSSNLYAPLKRICETGRWARDLTPDEPNDPQDPTGQAKLEVNILSQCVVPVPRVKDKYLTNAALKINVKCGGYNTLLAHEENKSLPKVSEVPTCIFGLAVSHGSPGDATSPSIAAAVASNNWPNFSTYTMRARAQAPKTAMIEGLYDEVANKGGMVMELVEDFISSCEGSDVNNRKPQQFVIFRDGVSESQFEQVLEKELTAFKKAARALESNPNSTYKPKVTFIVVQKRHHTRFFPMRDDGYVRPGTIVDTDVCHPQNNDFFLSSHAGIVGTTKPTHYHVLYDEIGFTPDELQLLTHCLCYKVARCTRAVSVVAPTYYAHLAAQHCRNFIIDDDGYATDSVDDGRDDGSGSDIVYDGSDSTSSPVTGTEASFPALPIFNSKILKKMFYI